MDFNYNGKTIQTSGGIFPSRKDTPMDVRTRVETYADIATIPFTVLKKMFCLLCEYIL